MKYINKIDDSKQKVYNLSVATRILDLVDKLRLNSNDNDERRWVWELLQNAKDVAFDNQAVSIQIALNNIPKPMLEFKHNGKPFSIDNITFLIEQVSTKERNNETDGRTKPTGKFGTGFLTTHLLSEKVDLEAVVKEPELPYKTFNLELDRSGTTIDEIIKSVNNSLKQLNLIDEQEESLTFNQNEFNTNFRYHLNENGVAIARKGLDDLEISLPFTLAFVPSIQKININSDIEYRLIPNTTLEDNDIEIYTIQKKYANDSRDIHIATLSNDKVTIAIEIEYNNGKVICKEPNPILPRLFCDFPLIGTEDFKIPIIINSSQFNPTEPRNGIYLSDKTDDKIKENKLLITQAKELYIRLLEHASRNNWMNVYVLADIALPKPKEWISKEWIASQFTNPLRETIIKTPLIDHSIFGRIPIECGGYNSIPIGATVDFPKHQKKEIMKILWELCNNPYFILPNEDSFIQWSKVIWDEKYCCNVISMVKLIDIKKDLQSLSIALQKDTNETIKWLNKVYILLEDETEHTNEINQKKIFPNQNGIFKKKEELYLEVGDISETLKDILRDLGDDFREQLAYKSIEIKLPSTNNCTADIVATQISKLIKPRLSEISRTDETRKIFKTLYLWFSQNKLQAEKIFDDLYKNKHKLLDDKEILTSIEKAELLDELLKSEPLLSVERIQELLEIEALSKGLNINNDYNPDAQQKLINFANGWKGEAFVFKTLFRKGYNIIWPNKSNTQTANQITDFEGEKHFIDDKMKKYDLEINLNANNKIYIQVKSTTTDISRADEIAMPISTREWKFINEIQIKDTYYLARVFNVASQPEVYFMKVDKLETI